MVHALSGMKFNKKITQIYFQWQTVSWIKVNIQDSFTNSLIFLLVPDQIVIFVVRIGSCARVVSTAERNALSDDSAHEILINCIILIYSLIFSIWK